jgi:hypothetical protein
MTGMITSRAAVATQTPERYAKQLIAHLGRRIEFATEGAVTTGRMVGGTGRIIVEDGRLMLEAQAADRQTVELVQDVLGGHLKRFGEREGLDVAWAMGPDDDEHDR